MLAVWKFERARHSECGAGGAIVAADAGGETGRGLRGNARYLGVDVTLVRILWIVLMVWPLPLFGLISYIVAWIVMPKDPVAVPAHQMHPANGGA